MANPDYYRELGVEPAATNEEIRAAFRRLAALHHPDRNPGSEAAGARFRRLSEAYDTLSDPAKRAAYDGSRPKPPSGAIRGRDYETVLLLKRKDAATGGRTRFVVEDDTPCGACGGRGCWAYGGSGIHPGPREVNLRIPRALEDGTILRLRGLGAPGQGGGEPGDLLVRVRLTNRRSRRA